MQKRWWQSPQQAHDPNERRAALPSWLISLGVHLLIYVVLLFSFRDRDPSVGGSENGFEVAIFSEGLGTVEGDGKERGGDGRVGDQPVPEGDTGANNLPPAGDAQNAEQEAAVARAIGESLDQLTREQSVSSLLGESALLGNGSRTGDSNTSSVGLPASIGGSALLSGVGVGGPGRGGKGTGSGSGFGGSGTGTPGSGGGIGGGRGGTSFFHIEASGLRFVYVVDHSGSMGFHRQLAAAKAELQASLQALSSSHQFQIIFYNDLLNELRLRESAPGLNWASETNKMFARQFLFDVQPDGGTNHMAALRKAISYKPENIFFLTDADEPQLTAKELAEIKRLNAGRSRLHCVEFGKGPDIGTENFLQRLARENGGSYRYQDITQFGSR